MELVLALYAQPYDPSHPMVCFDEKSMQLLADNHGARTTNIGAREPAICSCSSMMLAVFFRPFTLQLKLVEVLVANFSVWWASTNRIGNGKIYANQ